MGNKGSRKATQKKIPRECVGKEDSENGGLVVVTEEEEEMNLGVFESNSHSFVVIVVAFSLFIVSQSLKISL